MMHRLRLPARTMHVVVAGLPVFCAWSCCSLSLFFFSVASTVTVLYNAVFTPSSPCTCHRGPSASLGYPRPCHSHERARMPCVFRARHLELTPPVIFLLVVYSASHGPTPSGLSACIPRFAPMLYQHISLPFRLSAHPTSQHPAMSLSVLVLLAFFLPFLMAFSRLAHVMYLGRTSVLHIAFGET